ncbi:MAG TPA: Gfo/Idh/MocA family oxidoreductase [Solirubrobacteraceae bacterium]|nr:Gfo/Idh/MocA family oxidoreductase [Solirubrobacteraceae bacterium]
MLDRLAPIAAACDLTVPAAHRRPVAVVGAGSIVDAGHLPAYRAAGIPVAGIHDRDAERAREVARRHEIGRVYASLDELLADDAVAAVDIAVHPSAQPGIARACLDAGRHVVCQKPLALEVADAEALVAHAEHAGLQLAVNQQLRFDEGIAAAHAMLHAGWIGEPLAVLFDVDIRTDFTAWSWLAESERLEILYHSIHYFDAIRWLVGEPHTVFCTGARSPGQRVRGETRTIATLVYGGDLRALVHTRHENVSEDRHARFSVEGSEGTIRGTLGLLYDYPHGRPDSLEVFSKTLPTDGWLPYPVTTRWVPDAFAGPMGELLRVVAEGGEHRSSGRANLGTLRLVDALYRSLDTGASQAVEPTRAAA